MKKLLLMALLLPGIAACKKKNKSTEYFSFDANGVHYDYPQIIQKSLLGGHKTLSAYPTSASVGYLIYAYSLNDPTARGGISFNFSGNHIPDRDTIIMDGNINTVRVSDFLTGGVYYDIHPPKAGRIIFTERSTQRITGTFEFEVEQYRISATGGTEWTGNTLNVTNGKFSIIPTN